MTLAIPFPMQNAAITFGAAPVYGEQQEEVPAGVWGFGDLLVAARGTPAMACTVAAGTAYVNMVAAAGGLRRINNDASSDSGVLASLNSTDWTATFTAADATNPRIDSVYLVCRDSTLDVTGAQDAKFTVVAGTATVGATLDNRTGAGSAPSNSILLADVLVSAGVTTLVAAKFRDRRQMGPMTLGTAFATTADIVPLIPVAGATITGGALLGATNAQAAVLCYLPRRIVSATKVRWGYRQTATPTTGTYTIAICDTRGRAISTVNAASFTGAANTDQLRSETITAQTFEAGLYWVFYGQVLTAGASVIATVAAYKSASGEIPYQGIYAYRASALGTTFPPGGIADDATAPLADAAATPSNVQYGVPLMALSVG